MIMLAFRTIYGLLSLLAPAFALPRPHNGMTNNGIIQDVGVSYPEKDLKGNPSFLFAMKKERQCMQVPRVVKSIAVCVPACCTFYMTQNCSQTFQNPSFTVFGPADFHKIADSITFAESYICEFTKTNTTAGKITLSNTIHESRYSTILSNSAHDLRTA